MSFQKNTIGLILGCLILAGCTPTKATRGNLVHPTKIEQIQVGSTSKRELVRLIGNPTTVATFDENIWYYIGEKTETSGMFEPEVIERLVLIMRFKDDVLDSIAHIDETNGQTVELIDRRTPTAGKDFTILQQLIGNVGRFRGDQKQ